MLLNLSECSPGPSAEDGFNTKVGRMTSVDTSQPPSSATPVIAQWANEQGSHGVAMWISTHKAEHSPRPTLSAPSASSETNTGPLMCHHARG